MNNPIPTPTQALPPNRYKEMEERIVRLQEENSHLVKENALLKYKLSGNMC